VFPSASLALHGRAVYLLNPSASDDGRATVWASPDGLTWSAREAPCSWDGGNPGALATWSGTGLAVICGGQPSAGTQGKTAFESADGGRHWSRRSDLPLGGYVGSLAAADQNTWALGEPRGGIVVTHDGGTSWAEAAVAGAVDVEGWGYIGFTDPGHGVAVPWGLNGSALAFSRDSGRDWDAVSFPGGR
jgi:hypothetical protein